MSKRKRARSRGSAPGQVESNGLSFRKRQQMQIGSGVSQELWIVTVLHGKGQ